ncbi:MAG: (4Fe-4S)-binding protein [Bacteroidia bacterium]|nr:(4Fe-4S)-binding protein [Bacteroidia bacterium]
MHSGNCVKGLPEVFEPSKRPWIDQYAASTDQIVAQVNLCPSCALSTRIEKHSS